MTRWSVGVAVALLCAGLALLGTRWEGIEVSPGVWQDSVSLEQWARLWAALAVLGLASAGRLPRWRQRLAVLAPLLVWIGWSLAGGTLTPLAWTIYAVPTVIAWSAGTAAGDAARRLARSVKRRST